MRTESSIVSSIVEMPAPSDRAVRALRLRDVCAVTGLSRHTLWRLRQAGRFPVARRLSIGAIGWLKSDVEAWVRSRPFA
jgi:prophage regulatory protein